MACILKKYEVNVPGYGSGKVFAKNKNQARVRTFYNFQSAFPDTTFKRFLQIVGTIEEIEMPRGFAAPILANDKPAFLLESAGGNSLRFCYPDSDQVLLVHELDVTEVQAVQLTPE